MKLKKIFLIVCILVLALCNINILYATDEGQIAQQEQTNEVQEATATEVNNEQEDNEIITKAKVIKTGEIKDIQSGDMLDKVQYLKVRILDGEYKDDEYESMYILSYDIENKILAYELDEGDTVLVQINKKDDGTVEVQVQDLIRQNYLIWMIILFFASIVVIGGKQGVKAILGLIVTILIIFLIMIGSIYKGYNPIIMAIISSLIVIVATFMIIGGINKKVITAAIGTLGGVMISGIIALIFGNLAKLSGAQEDAILLSTNATNLVYNFRQVLVAGIIVSSLGATMDVGMSIASSLDEITAKELFKS